MHVSPQLVLAMFVVVVMGGSAVRIQLRRRQTAGHRLAAGAEPVRFEAAVGVKYRLTGGGWSTKTLGGLRLVVGDHHWSVVMRPRWLGAVLGAEWAFPAQGTTISFGPLPGDPLHRPWLVLDATLLQQGAALALSLPVPRGAWDNLTQIGAAPAHP